MYTVKLIQLNARKKRNKAKYIKEQNTGLLESGLKKVFIEQKNKQTKRNSVEHRVSAKSPIHSGICIIIFLYEQ